MPLVKPVRSTTSRSRSASPGDWNDAQDLGGVHDGVHDVPAGCAGRRRALLGRLLGGRHDVSQSITPGCQPGTHSLTSQAARTPADAGGPSPREQPAMEPGARARRLLLTSTRGPLLSCRYLKQRDHPCASRPPIEALRGSLDLLVLKTLSLSPTHGWGISQRVQQMSGGEFEVNQGSLYPALQRLEKEGLIASDWGVTDNNRQARYYRLTAAGRRALGNEVESWKRFAAALDAVLRTS